jgi:hypothetical protein
MPCAATVEGLWSASESHGESALYRDAGKAVDDPRDSGVGTGAAAPAAAVLHPLRAQAKVNPLQRATREVIQHLQDAFGL